MYVNNEAAFSNSRLTLAMGVDGSGKTSLLSGVAERDGTKVLEPTSSPEAREFKNDHLNKPIDETYVNDRERLFLALNEDFDARIQLELEAGYDVATSGSALITMISHALMRQTIGVKKAQVNDIVDNWIEAGDSRKPQQVVFLYAPDKVIKRRLEDRQLRGIATERFYGFNSLDFLSRYQDTLFGVVDRLATQALLPTVSIDTSMGTKTDTLYRYFDAVDD